MTWLGPSKKVWEARYGVGTFPYGQASRALRPLLDGADAYQIAEHLEVYLERTPARFVSITRFAQTFSQWNPKQLSLLVDEDGALTAEGLMALDDK